MEKHPTTPAESNQKMERAQKVTEQALYGNTRKEKLPHPETEEMLNAKILKITMKIRNEHPELSKYIEEMTVTIPDEKHPEITLQNLRSYYNTLCLVVNKYVIEHPENTPLKK